MRIVHMYDGHEKVYNGRGSVPDVVWNLAIRTAARGHEVTVLERRWEGLENTAVHEGVTFHRIALWTGADEPWDRVPHELISTPLGGAKLLIDRTNFARKALGVLEWLKADVIHVHLPFAANVVATVAPHLRDAMVYTAHLGETEARVSDPVFSPDAYLAKRVARTIALNPEMRRAFAARGVPSDQLVVVPNGVDIDRFETVDSDVRDRFCKEYRVADSDTTVLFVGSVTARKGVLELIEAATTILETRENVRFLIVGPTDIESEYVERVREQIEATGIGDVVSLTGFVSEAEVHAAYDVADVFVLPSSEEGSSVAVTEAMAAGLPIVGSDIDGIRQKITHGTHGLLTEAGDVDALAACIGRLIDNDTERKAMQEAVEDQARTFSWATVTDRMIDVYAEVAQ